MGENPIPFLWAVLLFPRGFFSCHVQLLHVIFSRANIPSNFRRMGIFFLNNGQYTPCPPPELSLLSFLHSSPTQQIAKGLTMYTPPTRRPATTCASPVWGGRVWQALSLDSCGEAQVTLDSCQKNKPCFEKKNRVQFELSQKSGNTGA